jgi:uncharacterized protein (DUF1697 family)
LPRTIALLRGINLGRRRLKMDRLKELFEELRFADVGTFIASGNVLFGAASRDRAALERKIERHLQAALGYEVDTFVRTAAELAEVVAYSADQAAGSGCENVYVSFFREPLGPERTCKLAACETATDRFVVRGTELFWLCRTKLSESTVWTSPAMKAVGLPATSTMRNLTTLRKLSERA